MLPYPQIDPVAIALGPLKIHWYGLMYLVGIGGAWLLASRRLERFDATWTKDKLSDLVFWVAMGVILGGRLGYVFFYDFAAYIAEPAKILRVWEGGMSFHGGLIGVMLATWWLASATAKASCRTHWQLYQRRAVGQGRRCALGDGLSHRPRATGAASVAAVSVRPGRRGAVHHPLVLFA